MFNRKIFNLPNFLTVLRVIFVPLFIICLFQRRTEYYYSALGLFIAASITDYFDGYLARKWDQTTEFGKFLDPLADKILIQGALVSFLFLDSQIEIWMVASIILRDILITGLRSVGLANGKDVKTFVLAKWKTAFQMGAVLILVLLFSVVPESERLRINSYYDSGRSAGISVFILAFQSFQKFVQSPGWIVMTEFMDYFLVMSASLLTIFSGLQYFYEYPDLLKPKAILNTFRRRKTDEDSA